MQPIRPRTLRSAGAALAVVVVIASCGSGDQGATEPPITAVDSADPTPTTTEASESPDTDGSGGADASDEAEIEAPLDEPTRTMPNDQPTATEPPTTGPPSTLGEDALVPDETFVVAPQDTAFCTKLEELSEQLAPGSDDEMAAALQEIYIELRPLVPDELIADFDVLDAMIGQVVAGQTDLDAAQDDPQAAASADRIDEFIDVRCEGRDLHDSSVGEPELPTVDDPPLPDGLVIPVVSIEGATRDGSIPYFGSRSDGGGPADPEPGFQVAPADLGFCTAVAIINRRPQPADDFEEIVVGQQYFDAIAPTVPVEVADDFAVITAWVDAVVEARSIDAVEEPTAGDPLIGAIDALDSFVDTRCLGR